MATYEELLQDNNWKRKRQLILERDHRFCQECKNTSIKNASKRATYLKNIKFFQILDGETGPFSIRNDYTILIRDDSDGSEHQTFVSLRNDSLNADQRTRYIVFYSKEKNLIDGTDRTYVNYLEDTSKPENQRYIFVRGLHVHHNYYQDEKLPWEYPDTALKTLCWMCHEKFHSHTKVDWLDKNGNKRGQLTPCDRCHGAGYLPQYRHVQSGVCFKCRGGRYMELPILT